MFGDLRNEIDAFTFKKLMNSSNPDNYLVDLTFGLINIAIEQGHKPLEEPAPIEDSNCLSHRNSPNEKSPGLLPVKKLGKGVCKPRLGYDFSKISCLRELKEGNQLYNLLYYILQQVDRDLFMKLRTGELSLTQICSRVEYEKSGLWFASLDDIRHKLPQSILDKINN